MPQEEFQALLQFFKAMADETRLKLLGILANGERSVEELAALLHLRAPTVSHHLARLKELDLVGMRSEGNIHYYWLNVETLRQTNKLLLTPERMASLVTDIEGNAWERKVLRDFLEDSRIKEIPSSVKKRMVILRWLTEFFEEGRLYTEAQVNEILKAHHPDTAYLRREMISSQAHLLQRELGLYWRLPTGKQWKQISLRARDRVLLHGWVGVPEGKGPFPTILEIHEGPEVALEDWLSPLAGMWLDHGFAYCVINVPLVLALPHQAAPYVKIHSSGTPPVAAPLTLQERIEGHPGQHELADLELVRGWLIEQGIAAEHAVVLTGWRYNALLVLLALGMQPEFWAAGIAGEAVTDWLLNYEEDEDRTFVTAIFEGTPAEKSAAYKRYSPISYVAEVMAPLLLFQRRTDPRYSLKQAQRYQEALQQHGKALDLHLLDATPATSVLQLMVQQKEVLLNFVRALSF